MADQLTLFTNPMSRGRIARWMLEEVGRPYETEILEYGGSLQGPAYLAINPMGKVPAIRHGDTVVTETAAICAYLADAFPQAKLAPPSGSKARGPYYRWLFFAAGPIEAATSNKMMGVDTTGRETQMGYGSLARVLDVMEKAVDIEGYLAGPEFSAADVYMGAQIGWGMQFGSVERRPAFERYWPRLEARPAWLKAKAIDDALTPAPKPATAG